MTRLPLLGLFAHPALAQAEALPARLRFYTHALPPYSRQMPDGKLGGTIAEAIVRGALDRLGHL